MQTMTQTQAKNRIGETMQGVFGRNKPVFPESHYKEKIGVPKKTFRKYVDNELQPRIDELTRIAQWLNVNPKDLF